MPIPSPDADESRDDFISRCVAAIVDEDDMDQDQAAAICHDRWEDVRSNNAEDMLFACSVANAVRNEHWEGRDWLVAPVVALRSGVLNNELVSPEEILAFPEAWNGRPFVVYHPISKEGRPISANSPEVISAQQIGQLFNVEANNEDGAKLKGEIWVDVAKATKLGGQAIEVVRRLRSNQPLEVSTAYYRDVVRESGVLGEHTYESIAKNIRPDHLAALPDQIGACSWADGCGAPRINAHEEADDDVADVQEEPNAAPGTNHEDLGGSEMDERIERIMADGRLAFNAEDLAEMSEGELDGILAALEALPEQEEERGDPDPEPTTNVEEEVEEDEEEDGGGEFALNAEDMDDVRVLIEAVREMGGVEAIREVVANHNADARTRHDALVAQLVANESCTVSRELLEQMNEQQLRALRQNFEPVDYLGMGAVRPMDGEVELEMPDIEWGEN